MPSEHITLFARPEGKYTMVGFTMARSRVVAAFPKRSFRRGRLSEQVISEIEKMIAEEFAVAGTRLPNEAALADRFQVSRIVIREAMKILEDRGSVEVRAGRGTVTVAPSPDRVKAALLRLFQNQPIPTFAEMERLLELREVLEESVAGIAAVRATPEDLKEIEAALSDMKVEHSIEGAVQADLRFHAAVANAAHNRYFDFVIAPLTEVFIQQMMLTDSFTLGLDLHRQIYEQIRKGNPVAARQAVKRLIRRTREDMKKALTLISSK